MGASLLALAKSIYYCQKSLVCLMVFLEQSILRFGFYLKTSSSSGKDQEREFANETKTSLWPSSGVQ